jgi:hypothetical protein
MLKPHLENPATGFDSPTTPTTVRNGGNVGSTPPSQPDIGSIIQSFLTTAMPVAPLPSIHLEKSDDGWQEATIDLPIRTGDSLPPMLEVTPDGSGPVKTPGIPPSYIPQITGPMAHATPPVPNPQVILLPQVTPPPAITHDGVTLRPVPVTSVRVTTIDGKPTTVEALVNYRYVAGSITLQNGTPTTINNVVVALSVNPAGSTILVAGDQTTTLPSPARGTQGAQAADDTQALKLSTTVVEGTTKYVLAGQTLAPGQAITVGDIPISIGTSAGSTVLVMGDVTTTFTGAPPITTSPAWGAPAVATSGVVSNNGNTRASTTSAKAGAASSRTISRLLTKLIGLAVLAQPFL